MREQDARVKGAWGDLQAHVAGTEAEAAPEAAPGTQEIAPGINGQGPVAGRLLAKRGIHNY